MKILGRLLCLIGAELKVILIIALLLAAGQVKTRFNVFTEFSVDTKRVTASPPLSTLSGTASQLRPLDEHHSPVLPPTSNNILSTARVFPRIRCTPSAYLVKVCRLAFAFEDPTTVATPPSKFRVMPDYSNFTRYCQTNASPITDLVHEKVDCNLCHQHDKPMPKYPAFILLFAIFIYCSFISLLTYRFGWLFIKWVFLSPIIWALCSSYSDLPSDILYLTLLAYVLYPDYVSLSLSELCTLLLHCLSLLSTVQNIPGEALERAINVASRRALELAFFALVKTLLYIDKLLSGVDITKIRLKTREARRFIERRRKRVMLAASPSSGEIATLYTTPTKRSEVRDRLVAQSRSGSDISATGTDIPLYENDDVFRSNGASLKPAGSDAMLANSPLFKSSSSILRIEIPEPTHSASQSDVLQNSESTSKTEDISCLRSSSPSPVSKNCRNTLTIRSLVPSDSIAILTNSIPIPFSRTSSPVPSSHTDALAAINSPPGSTSFRALAEVVKAGDAMCSASRSASLVALAEVLMVTEPNIFSSKASLLAMSGSDIQCTSSIPVPIVSSNSVVSVSESGNLQDDSYYDANGSLLVASSSCALAPSVSATFPFSRGNSPIPCTRTFREMSVPVTQDVCVPRADAPPVFVSPAITSPPRARSVNISAVLSPEARSHKSSSSIASSGSGSGSSRLAALGRVRYKAVRAIMRKGVQDVFVAECTQTGSQVILRTALRDTPGRENLLQEAMTLRQVRGSPWFPTLIDKYSEGGESKFVTTYYQRGSLAAHILKMGGFLSPECARFYLAEIMLALETLHSRGVVHHDINLQNLLLTDDGHIIISNFSQSTRNHFILNTKSKRRRTVRFDGEATNHEVTQKAIERAIDNGDDDFYQMALAYHQMITGVKVKFTEPLVHEDIKCRREHMQDMGDVDIAFLEMVLDRYPFECASLPELLTHPIFEHLDLPAMRDQSVPVPDMQCRQVRSSREKTASPRSPPSPAPPAPLSTAVISPHLPAARLAYSPPDHPLPSLVTALSPHLRAARSPAHFAGGGAPYFSLTPLPALASPPPQLSSRSGLHRKRSSFDWINESPFLKIPPLPHEEASPLNTPRFEMPSQIEYYDHDYGDN